MKKLYILILVAGMMFATSVEADAGGRIMRFFNNNTPSQEQAGNHNTNGDAVGAPLDGGLLAILAAAGGAYFVARRKKKKQQ